MPLEYQRLRAPQADQQTLAVPSLGEVDALWQNNHQLLSTHDLTIGNTSLHDLRASARQRIVDLATRYSQQYRDISIATPPHSIVMSGHQPTLFHPGVWHKNFALSHFGERWQATAINLVVDNDLCSTTEIRVPHPDVSTPRTLGVKYDQGLAANLPYEVYRLQDRELWTSFEQRVISALDGPAWTPLIHQLWPQVLEAHEQGLAPPYAMAAGRHRLEANAGLQTLEIPLSQIANTSEFITFAAELLTRAGEFREAYNQVLYDYRQLNRIRSNARPVPDLSQIDDWWETPFWVWSTAQPTRRRLYVKNRQATILLSNQHDWEIELAISELANSLAALSQDGYAFRPRALITTMYARLVLSDLFIHGIGGAKYDQVTDAIVERFFGVSLPSFFTLTSTHRLPLSLSPFNPTKQSDLKNHLRSLVYHPERHVSASNPAEQSLVADKKHLLATLPLQGSRQAWHQSMTQINQELQPYLEAEKQSTHEQLQAWRVHEQQWRTLGSREYSFCLHDVSLIQRLKHAFLV